jgi:hypothetical protein
VATPGPSYDPADVIAACESGFPCGGQVNGELTAVVPITRPGGTALYAIAQCLPPGGGNCPAGSGGAYLDAQVNVYQAIIDLTSNASPAATSFGGALLTPGPVSGTQPLTFTATAPGGPGVYKVTVAVDGHPVYDATPDRNSGQCATVGTDATGAPEFLSAQPCKTSVAVSVPVDTTTLADGPHDLSVTVADAAGNSSPVLHQTIVFANSTLTLSGTLRNSAGVPAPGVPVTLLAQEGGLGTPQAIARATSGATGHWALAAPRGPSRKLTIVPGSQAQAASTQADVTISETVTPGLSLRVRALGGARLRFTGQLAIKPIASPRPLVFIEARSGSHWQIVATTHVVRTGAYTLDYTGKSKTIGQRYEFRAVAPATSLFTAAASPNRQQTVQ